MLSDLVTPCYAKIDTTFADKGGYIRCREEYQGEGKVLDECNVQSRVAMELDIGAMEEVEAGLVEAALCNVLVGGLLKRREVWMN
jgi:hypothetical protein